MDFRFDFIWESLPKIFAALPTTILLTFIPVVVGLFLGFPLAIIRIRKTPILYQLVSVYLSFFRSIPLLILLFLAYYGGPKLANFLFHDGMRVSSAANLSSFSVAIVVLTLYSAAFLCEIIRGALSSVNMNQMEAAHAIGMTKAQSYLHIIIPQTVIVALPNYFNFVLALLKGTAVVFTIAVMDIMNAAKTLAEDGYRFIEAYAMVGTIYILFSLILSAIFQRIEQNAKKHIGLSTIKTRKENKS